MKKLVILLTVLLSMWINAFEILQNGDIKIKGLMVAYWETEEEDTEIKFYLIPEDLKKFNGKAIIVETEDRDKIESPGNKERKTREIFKRIPGKEKDEMLMQPVIVTLKPLKYAEWDDRGEIFSTLKKFERADRTTAVYKYKDNADFFRLVYGEAPSYRIYSKEGYSNLRKKPEAKSEIVRKLKNGQRTVKIFETGDWVYTYNFLESGDVAQNEVKGYIHKSQIK